jgi:hypothetical protein
MGFSGQLAGQDDSLILTKNFKFRDGIYLSLEQLHRNRPAYTWDELDASLVTNPQTFVTKAERIRPLETEAQDSFRLDDIWAVSLGGIPYIRLEEVSIPGGMAVFAGLRVRGKICYFSYEGQVTHMVEVKAYNPLTGRPFRSATVPREERVAIEKMMRFETGEIKDFTPENFLEWIEDDPLLWQTVKELRPEEAKEKLFKSLLIYVDRKLVYVGG